MPSADRVPGNPIDVAAIRARRPFWSATTRIAMRPGLVAAVPCVALFATCAGNATRAADGPADPTAGVTTEAQMKPYTETVSGTEVKFDLVPIKGGEFLMGSPKDADPKSDDELPQHPVRIEPFWMGKHEVTWEEYDVWNFDLDIQRRKVLNLQATALDKDADAVTRPTKPYTDMTFDMGHDGYPAISMTQLAAKVYCQWLSAKTGHYYRLPTEAEWEYACRAGTKTAYSFGDDAADLKDYAWSVDNSRDKYHKVGTRKPNPWGLYDMHGNVAEWVLDEYVADFYGMFPGDKATPSPLSIPKVATKEHPRIVRGGSWNDDPEKLRSAARTFSDPDWKVQDPQLPQSVWYHTDARHVGFRVVRPLRVPTAEERRNLQLDPVIPKEARFKKQ